MKKNLLCIVMSGLLIGPIIAKHLKPCKPHEHITNAENSVLYAEAIAADHTFSQTYDAQPVSKAMKIGRAKPLVCKK